MNKAEVRQRLAGAFPEHLGVDGDGIVDEVVYAILAAWVRELFGEDDDE